ncbi:MAG: hypothetical protein V4772_19280 [Pseudomonadota bacterium]
MVTKHGTEAAVGVPANEWLRLPSASQPSLKQLLLSNQARVGLLVPPRGQGKRRYTKAMD